MKKLLLKISVVALLAGCGGSSAVVTQAEYSQIQTGMSYQQVAAIVGDPGTQSQKQEIAGFTTETYMWQNANGSNLLCMFQNGKLVNKTGTQLP
jgi:catalase